jgi:hypothetical protein
MYELVRFSISATRRVAIYTHVTYPCLLANDSRLSYLLTYPRLSLADLARTYSTSCPLADNAPPLSSSRPSSVRQCSKMLSVLRSTPPLLHLPLPLLCVVSILHPHPSSIIICTHIWVTDMDRKLLTAETAARQRHFFPRSHSFAGIWTVDPCEHCSKSYSYLSEGIYRLSNRSLAWHVGHAWEAVW